MRVMRDMAMRAMCAIAGVPQLLGQFGWNAATNRLAVADSLTGFRDLAYNTDTIQVVASGTTDVLDGVDTVIVNNAAATATVRLPAPAASNKGRRVTIKRKPATSTGTVNITTLSGTLKVERTTGALVTSTALTSAAPRFGVWLSDGTVWHKIG